VLTRAFSPSPLGHRTSQRLHAHARHPPPPITLGNAQALAIVWSVERGCDVMPLSQGVPRYCFGHDTYENVLTSRSWIDVFTPLLHMANANGTRTTAINAFTCMPYHATMATGCSGGEDADGEGCSAPSTRPVSGGRLDAISIFYNNATLWPAPATAYAFPSWCTYADQADGNGLRGGASLLGRSQRHRITPIAGFQAAGITVEEAALCAVAAGKD
jgi:hypothetical protein